MDSDDPALAVTVAVSAVAALVAHRLFGMASVHRGLIAAGLSGRDLNKPARPQRCVRSPIANAACYARADSFEGPSRWASCAHWRFCPWRLC